MELLVAGSIINLSLPVRQVFELFWKPLQPASTSQAASAAAAGGAQARTEQEPIGPAMNITFRLQVCSITKSQILCMRLVARNERNNK